MTLKKTQIISGPYQSAFVANKIITHGIIIAFGNLKFMKEKKRFCWF